MSGFIPFTPMHLPNWKKLIWLTVSFCKVKNVQI